MYIFVGRNNLHHFGKQMSKPGKKQVAFMTNTFCKLCRQLISTDLRVTTVRKIKVQKDNMEIKYDREKDN